MKRRLKPKREHRNETVYQDNIASEQEIAVDMSEINKFGTSLWIWNSESHPGRLSTKLPIKQYLNRTFQSQVA